MKQSECTALNAWLANADNLYIDGRLLWLQSSGMAAGTCILLWLSIEQILKTLIFQERINIGDFTSEDYNIVFEKFNEWGRDFIHGLDKIIKVFCEFYPDSLNASDIEVLSKIYEFFNRRYVSNTGAGIPVDLITQIDSIYFKLRDLVSPKVPASFIDEIALRKEKNQKHYLESYMQFAYLNNPSFHIRENITNHFDF